MNFINYANLHVHTDKSNLKLIDSINKTKNVIDYAYTLGHKGIAITDHDCLSAHIEALKHYDEKYADKDFKLVLGNEIYLTKNDICAQNHDSYEYNHFILLAKDKIGHQQLRELSSRAWERSYNKFKIMRTPTYYSDLLEVVRDNPGHLIASSACLGGYIPKAFERKDFEAINEFVELMHLIFGEENFFIEMQPSHQKEQIDFNKYVIENFPAEKIIITTDAHYLKKEDRSIHESFLKSKEGEREVADFYSAAYMMSVDEIAMYMPYIDVNKLNTILNNSGRILDRIESYSLKQEVNIPKIEYEYAAQFEVEDSEYMELISYYIQDEDFNYIKKMFSRNISDKYLVHLIFRGLFEKIDTENVDLGLYINRLNYELEQIYKISEKIGSDLSDYFITMAKIIDVIWSDGDSLVGVSRGSGAGYLLNYLIGITQIDPLVQPLEMSPWRFIHESRPELPDIDIDTESTKRKRIFNKVQEYFNSIGGDLINVCAFGTEGSKSAIKTAARGLGIDDDLATYLTSMIPNERGKDLTLSQCYYGDEDHQPIKKFVEEMNRNPELWLVSKNIEGLVTRLTVHAAGVIVLNGAAYERNSKMKTNSGVVVTAYNLGDSEYMGGLKYDFLTVQALDKIRTCMNLLLEDGIMEWKGSLRNTYNHYLLPARLDYDNKDMWKKLCDGDIIDVFQYDTQVGSQAIKKIRPQSIVELAVANSVMRLMSSDGGELPLETYVRFKNNINLWYNEMRLHGLNNEEIAVLEKYLKPLSGVADSQEAAMLLSMDPNIAGFSVKDANKLRKAIAKKKADVMEEVRQLFYSMGTERGTSQAMLDYVWKVQMLRQAGYSFSVLHTMGYSTIALQEMNLVYRFPDIYWKTACLSTNANAVNEEDYEFLIEEEIITELDEEDKKEGNKVQYGKVASALIDFKQNDTKIILPNINKSKLGFAPDLENNAILFGLKGITKIGSELIMEIFKRRPFTSLSDFIHKMNCGEKSLISKDKIVNLIKSGCFDEIEQKGREEILKDYLTSIADTKKNLTLQNMQMLIKNNLLPDSLEDEIKIYNFTKLLRKNKDTDKIYYVLDEVYFQAIDYKYPEIAAQVVFNGDRMLLPMKIWDNFYSKRMDVVRKYIEIHKQELLAQINQQAIDDIVNKYGKGSVLDWEMEALNFYYSGHPLDYMDLTDFDLTSLSDLKEDEITSHFTIKTPNGPKMMPIYRLRYICGSVIDKNKAKGTVTLQCQDGVIDIKLFKQQYARYSHVISSVDENNEKVIIDDSFFEKGTHLLICGIKRSDMFVPKIYKNTGHDAILKIITNDKGDVFLSTKM